MILSVDFPSNSSILSVPFEVSVPRSISSVNVNLNMSSPPLSSSSDNGDSSCDDNHGNASVTGEAEAGILSSNRHSLRWIKYVTCKSHNDETSMQNYLSERPKAISKQSKYSRDRTKKYGFLATNCS